MCVAKRPARPARLADFRLHRTKLSLSHALSQSVKISLFEELISSTIEQTKDIPKSLSETGKIEVSFSCRTQLPHR